MTRTRATPVSAQLRRWLDAPPEGTTVFSAVDLAEIFEHPRRQDRKTTIGAINKALKKAHSEAKVVCFVDDRGVPLRVKEHVEPGSKSNEHPTVYGLPGTLSPDADYRPAAYDEINRAAAPDTDVSTEVEASPEVTVEDASSDELGDSEEVTVDGVERLIEIKSAIDGYEPPGPAPEWVPDAVLSRLVALPTAQASWRKGLDAPHPADRLVLINAGVRRKGEFTADSVSARAMVALMRKEPIWFSRLLYHVRGHFKKKGPPIPDAELVAFVEDPEAWALEHDGVPVEFVVAIGLMAGADEDALADVAEAFAEEPSAVGPTVEESLRLRAEELQRIKDELNRQLKEALREGEKQQKVVAGLRGELDEFRAGQEQAEGSLQAVVDGRSRELVEMKETVANLEAELEAARDEVEAAKEESRGDAQIAELEGRIEIAETTVDAERRLRQSAEEREQQQAARARDLARQLSHAGDQRMQLPVDDASQVLAALAAPVGEAARAAADRLALGVAQPDDFRLLELAAAYGRQAAEARPPAPLPTSPGTEAGDSEDATLRSAVATSDERQALSQLASADVETVGEDLVVVPEADTVGAVEADNEVELEVEPVESPGEARQQTAAGKAAARRLPFTITPLGGAEEVGGSALVVSTPGGSVLLDAGQRVKGEYGDPELQQFHYAASGVERLDAILVSHAHIDHVGSLPVLAQEYERLGHRPPIWMSEPTLDLAKIMLRDSAKIQAAASSRQRHIAELADSDLTVEGVPRIAYEEHDVEEVLAGVTVALPDQAIPIPGTDLVARFQPVDHVLGACAIHLKHRDTGKSLLYTGDLGPFTDPQETLPGRNPIDTLHDADVVIMESTYGIENVESREGRRRLYTGREQARKLLQDSSEKALARGGFVLLPAFSLGRTQELLRLLASREMPEAPIYVGGMGERITNIYADWGARRDGVWVPPGRFASGIISINRWLRDHPGFTSAAEEVLGDQKPGYLIVSPAMLSGGWSRAFLELMVEDERHAIVFTGYLPKNAGGIFGIERRTTRTGGMLNLPDQKVRIRADWQVLRGLSAHAPANDLRKFAAGMTTGRKVAFGCVHGEAAAQQDLANWIEVSVEGATGQSMSRNTPWVPSTT